jgi:glycosyltransferase involved in cell wall biosynthesis
VLGIAPYVRDQLDGLAVRRFEILSETALEHLPMPVERPARAGAARLLYVGRLVRTKGARDAIRALSQLADLEVELDIVGDGPERTACDQLVSELGLADRVRFHGRLGRDEIDDLYRSADVFFFPSYREPGGNVIFEAMGFGLPIVTTDRGGPGSAVDPSSGIRVTPVDPGQFANDLATAVRRLVTDPQLRLKLGAGARARVAQTALWDRKVDHMDQLYADISTALSPIGGTPRHTRA